MAARRATTFDVAVFAGDITETPSASSFLLGGPNSVVLDAISLSPLITALILGGQTAYVAAVGDEFHTEQTAGTRGSV